MLTPVKIEGFTGGLTDFPLGAAPNQFQSGDNCTVTKAGQLSSRPGSVPWDVTHTQLPTGNQRVGSLWNFSTDTALIAQSAARCFQFTAGWQELLGPSGNAFFNTGATTNRVSGGDWKGHLILANDAGATPMKVYRDVGGNFKSVTLGLPKFLLPVNAAYASGSTVNSATKTLANNIKAQMIAHFSNTNYTGVTDSPGAHAILVAGTMTAAPDTVSTAIITAANLNTGDSLATAIAFVTELNAAFVNHHADAIASQSVRKYHRNDYVNPGAPNIALSYIDPPKTMLGVATQLNELKQKFNWHVRSFKGHIDVNHTTLPLDTVTATTLANTATVPQFTDIDYSTLIAFANSLKSLFNLHLGDGVSHVAPGPPFFSMSGLLDTENEIYLANCTDLDSLFEMTVHVYCGYRDHQADAAFPIITLSGVNTHPGTPTLISSVASLGTGSTTTKQGTIGNIEAGMYVFFPDTAGSPDGSSYPLGTQVDHPSVVSNQIVTTQINNADGDSGGAIVPSFSFNKYHAPYFGGLPNFTSLVEAGNLATFDNGFGIMVGDPGTLSATLSDIALKFTQHDNDYGSTNYNGRLHVFQGAHAVDPTTIPTVQGFTYEYAAIFQTKYTTFDGTIFEAVSTPLFFQKKSYWDIGNSASVLTGFASIDAASTNYDTANIAVQLYRSIDGGQVLYYAGSITNVQAVAGASFTDATADIEIVNEIQIYTQGGVLASDPPPLAKYFHITKGGIPYWGWTTTTLDDGVTIETVPNRIMQGIGDTPDAAPAGNFVDLPDPVAGISSVRTVTVAWTLNQTFRLEGAFDEQGQGSITAVAISERVGLVGSFSPVQIDGAVVFAGPDQFYMTDGYSLTPLGRAWPKTYANLISGARAYNIQGTFDKSSNRVWYGATSASTENNQAFILDLNFPPNPGTGGCWTTASNGAYFAPTCFATFKGQVIRGDSRGYVLKHDPSYSSDARLDTTGANTAATNWFTRWVPYNYLGASLDFSLSGFRKWCSVIELKFYNLGNLSIQVTGVNDGGRTSGACFPIRNRTSTNLINERRFFPSGSLYFATKQVGLTNAKVGITNSDTLGLAAVTGGTTVTIAAGAFPADLVDQVIAFAADGYTAEYPITNETVGNTVLTVTGAPPNIASTKWVVRGYPKDEFMQLQEYTMWALEMGVNQTTAAGESGENS